MLPYCDLKGKRFGNLTVLELSENKTYNGTTKMWKCLCDCGNICYKDSRNLNESVKLNRIIRCNKHCITILPKIEFGDLTVLSYAYTQKGDKIWKCKCKCGEIFYKSTADLNRRNNLCKYRNIKYNKEQKKIRNVYFKMKDRCYRKNCKSFNDYGGRGITICDEWLKNPKSFYEWSFKNGYKDNLEIDRIDNNKGYSPDNCRWATKLEQANNKRNNLFIEYNNETKTLAQWCRLLNLPYRKTHKRIYMYKWDIEKALTDNYTRIGESNSQ